MSLGSVSTIPFLIYHTLLQHRDESAGNCNIINDVRFQNRLSHKNRSGEFVSLRSLEISMTRKFVFSFWFINQYQPRQHSSIRLVSLTTGIMYQSTPILSVGVLNSFFSNSCYSLSYFHIGIPFLMNLYFT